MKSKTTVQIAKHICIMGFVFMMMFMFQGCTSVKKDQPCSILNGHTYIDNMGNTITVDKPYKKIISLYSAHTENLYRIGAGKHIIGVGRTSIYPPDARLLPKYDYRSDPEPVIAAHPDLVIIRPFINRNYPDYVKALRKAGITVTSLYPSTWEEFETYTGILGMITGKEEASKHALQQLNERIAAIKSLTDAIPHDKKRKVFFESTKTAYRTIIPDANPARAIAYAGGINIASKVKPITPGSTIAEFGIEKLMMHAEAIDVYVSQRGAMNAGGSMISIPQREGFRAIKAVREGAILEINEKIISSPTFRYDKGVREIARKLYPHLMDDISVYNSNELLLRKDYAAITVMATHTPLFIPSSSHYYEKKHRVHSYGLFTDVSWQNEAFDYIETAVQSSYIKGHRHDDGTEYFNPEGYVMKEDIAYTLYILLDIKTANNTTHIPDIALCTDTKIVQKIVDNHVMPLEEDGKFHPKKQVTQIEAINFLLKGMETDS